MLQTIHIAHIESAHATADWRWHPSAGGAGHRVAAVGVSGREESGRGGIGDSGGGGSDGGGGSGGGSGAVEPSAPAPIDHES